MRKLISFLSLTIMIFITTPNLFSSDFENKTEIAKKNILKIETSLQRYKIIKGAYPEDGNQNLVSALFPKYAVFQPQEIKSGLLIDPWGKPYIYRRCNPANDIQCNAYVIYSVGPNGVDENSNGDDISP